MCKKKMTTLSSTANQYTKARLLAAATKHSGDWIEVIPAHKIGTMLSPEQLRIAVAQRLGCIVCENCLCRCGKRMDKLGFHALSCRLNAGRFPRHTEINSILKRALAKADIPSILEPAGLSRCDGKRPDGLTLSPWAEGRCLSWDATVTDTYCGTNLHHSAEKSASAAARAEKLKKEKYTQIPTHITFQPVALEPTGVWGPSTTKFLQTLSRRLRDASDDDREGRFLAQRLSLAIVRGNTASVLCSL